MENGRAETGFDPGTYGRSFAEVYDSWYPADTTTDAAVERISSLAGASGRILELGVGTGRLALPLAGRGHEVVGMDSSPEMLDLLAEKIRDAGLSGVVGVNGDVGNPTDWPDGRFDAVVAAFNLVFNLADEAAQRQAFAAAAGHLTPGGSLIIEAFIPAPIEDLGRLERNLELRSVSAAGVTLIATELDPATGVVVGQHIEMRDGEPLKLRPWRIRVVSPDEMDRWASAVGLVLVERHADWAMAGFSELGTNHVSVFRLAG